MNTSTCTIAKRKPAWKYPYVQTCKYTHACIHTCIKTHIHTRTHPSIRESNGPADEGAEERPDHRTHRTGYYNPLGPSPRTLALCLDDVVSLSHQSACFFCHHCRIRTDNEHNCHARHDEYALGAARAVKHLFVSFHHGRRPGGVKHISGSLQSPHTSISPSSSASSASVVIQTVSCTGTRMLGSKNPIGAARAFFKN